MGRLAADFSDLPDDEADLYTNYQEVLEQIEHAKGRDIQGFAVLMRMRMRIQAKMEIVAKAAEGSLADLSPEELTARLTSLFAAMPDPHLRIAVDTYCARLNFRLEPGED